MKHLLAHYDFLIVGTGLFGATAANRLNELGYKVLVIEKRNHIAGNIYTKKVDGIDIHEYGAHIFHTDNEEVWSYVNRFMKFHMYSHQVKARYHDELYTLPFNMFTYEEMFKTNNIDEIKEIIEKEKEEFFANHDDKDNLECHIIKMVGTTIYRKLVKEYTEKQWHKDCSELPSSIIKRLPMRLEYNDSYFNDKYQGIPLEGYTKLVENMLQGIEVILNVDYLEHKEEFDSLADHVIYTGQLDRLYNFKFGRLEYRSLRFENEVVNVHKFQELPVINYTDKEHEFTRIIEHANFLNQNIDKTYITKEYPKDYVEGDEPYYAVNNEINNNLYQKYFELTKQDKKLIIGGRLGLYKYFDMDDTILEALNLVKDIENGK